MCAKIVNKTEKKIAQIEAKIDEERLIQVISFDQLDQRIRKWLLIVDPGWIKVAVASVVANRLEGDPLWIFFVAASGGTKTEIIRALNKIQGIYPISDLTPQTFLSGEKSNKNASLLLRLPSNAILTYKDFTTVLTMHRDKRHAILSQLREIYDGYYHKEFGTGESKTWKGKIGFIAGVTPVIDTHYSIYQVLGERFIQYRPIQPHSIDLAKRVIANSGGESVMREEIANAFAGYLKGLEIPKNKIEIPEIYKDNIAHLATLTVKARSGVIRESYSSREIELIPDSELPTRLAKQFIVLMTAFWIMNGGSLTADDYELIFKVGMDTIPQRRYAILSLLYKAEDYMETSEIAVATKYPTNTTRRVLEDMCGLGLTLRKHQGAGHSDEWLLSDFAKEMLFMCRPVSLDLTEAKSNSDKKIAIKSPDVSGAPTLPEASPRTV